MCSHTDWMNPFALYTRFFTTRACRLNYTYIRNKENSNNLLWPKALSFFLQSSQAFYYTHREKHNGRCTYVYKYIVSNVCTYSNWKSLKVHTLKVYTIMMWELNEIDFNDILWKEYKILFYMGMGRWRLRIW